MGTFLVTMMAGVMATGASVDTPVEKPAAPAETRSIEMTVMAEATPEEIIGLWSTVEGTTKFFAPAARIGTAVGEPYEIIFEPVNDPEGAHHGTRGARILARSPARRIAFEWTFPPFGEAFNSQPYPTWVEVAAEPFPGNPEHSLVRFSHRGFPVDASWDRVFEVFRDGNWPLVINRFLVYCRDGVSPAWNDPKGDRLDRFLLKRHTVAAPVGEVWKSLTTNAGLRGFLCEDSRVHMTPGGPYEIYFQKQAPEGMRGTEGCKVVALSDGRWFTVTWNAPPPMERVRQRHTNVIFELSPGDGEGTTEIRLLALGWGTGDEWLAAHAYFDEAWDRVLGMLERSYLPAPLGTAEPAAGD